MLVNARRWPEMSNDTQARLPTNDPMVRKIFDGEHQKKVAEGKHRRLHIAKVRRGKWARPGLREREMRSSWWGCLGWSWGSG
jgi:hypothetical protein